jgi:ferredoxin
VCVPQCPVDAIVNAAEATPEQRPWIALNARLARDPAWRPITRSKPALPDAAHWAGVPDKRRWLQQPE